MSKKRRTQKKDKHYLVTGARLEEIRNEMAEEATHKACMILLGELAEMGWNEEQILNLFDRFNRHISYADDGVLPCKAVQEIVEKHTGIKFESRWY